jgi:hypothetical protein
MDAEQVAILRGVLPAGWLDRTTYFAGALRISARQGGLLLLGAPGEEDPWHLAAHLKEESEFNDIPELDPVLLRWSVPVGAPAHLSIGVDRLTEAGRGDAVFVVAEQDTPAPLLERINDARHRRATVLALGTGDKELTGLAHESLTIPSGDPLMNFDAAQHLVSSAAAEEPRRRGARDRFARLLRTITGPATE